MKNIFYITSVIVGLVIITGVLVTIFICNNKDDLHIIDFELKEQFIKSNSVICNFNINPGILCKKVSKKYGFNGTECIEFTYGGCGGNENNFDTLEQCVLLCI